MANPPTFRLSRGEANLTADAIDTETILMHYRDIARGAFIWSGLPEDMPDGFVEDSLFLRAGVGYKTTRALGPVVQPAKAVSLDIYAQPREWLPDPIGQILPSDDGTDLFTASDGPVLWLGCSTAERILPYAQIMSKALKTLGQNVNALSQPVLISGVASGYAGDNINAIMLKNDLSSGATYVPVVDNAKMPMMQVLDLKAQDHTQNLYSVIQACDAAILEIMGASMGPEKTSGVTTMETASGVMPVTMAHDWHLAMRRRWAERVNARFGTSVAVEPGGAWTMGQMTEDPGTGEDEGEDCNGDVDDDDRLDHGLRPDKRRGRSEGRERRDRGMRSGRQRDAQRGRARPDIQAADQGADMSPTCPYMDADCPKVEELQKDMDKMQSMVQNINRILYIIVGILVVDMGIMIV